MSLISQINSLITRIGTEMKAKMTRSQNLSDVNDRQTALNNLTDAANATSDHVLAKDPGTGNAIFKFFAAFPGFGTTSDKACAGDDTRLSNARTPLSHVHGTIGSSGVISSAVNKPLIGNASGQPSAGNWGTAPGTFCQGSDYRLSDMRTTFDNSITYSKIGSEFKGDLTITANAIDWSTGFYAAITLTANTTFTFTNLEKGKTILLKITGVFALTLPGSVTIVNGGTYDGTKQNFILLTCFDASAVLATINKP